MLIFLEIADPHHRPLLISISITFYNSCDNGCNGHCMKNDLWGFNFFYLKLWNNFFYLKLWNNWDWGQSFFFSALIFRSKTRVGRKWKKTENFNRAIFCSLLRLLAPWYLIETRLKSKVFSLESWDIEKCCLDNLLNMFQGPFL